MKYLTVEKFDNTNLVKTLMVPKDQARWRIYSYNIEDDMEDLKYYEELGKYFNITPNDMIRIPQRHSNNIMVVKNDDRGKGVTKMEIDGVCDGLITNEKGIMLLTIEADCTPVYILDTKNVAIGMVHSGWRGTVSKITENALRLMNENYGTKIDDVMIYLGPSICGNCYEVGNDLIPEFEKILDENEIKSVFKPIEDKKDKYLLDVSESIKLTLLKLGIKEEKIERSKYCTYHSNLFDSWRLGKDNTKQMLTGIMIT